MVTFPPEKPLLEAEMSVLLRLILSPACKVIVPPQQKKLVDDNWLPILCICLPATIEIGPPLTSKEKLLRLD
jgi:hypothetical protein